MKVIMLMTQSHAHPLVVLICSMCVRLLMWMNLNKKKIALHEVLQTIVAVKRVDEACQMRKHSMSPQFRQTICFGVVRAVEAVRERPPLWCVSNTDKLADTHWSRRSSVLDSTLLSPFASMAIEKNIMCLSSTKPSLYQTRWHLTYCFVSPGVRDAFVCCHVGLFDCSLSHIHMFTQLTTHMYITDLYQCMCKLKRHGLF